jgi:hypothetical protein
VDADERHALLERIFDPATPSEERASLNYRWEQYCRNEAERDRRSVPAPAAPSHAALPPRLPPRGPQQYVDRPGGQVVVKPTIGPERPATTLAGTPVQDTVAGVPRSSGSPATYGPGGPPVTGPSSQRLFDRTPPGRRPTFRPTNG